METSKLIIRSEQQDLNQGVHSYKNESRSSQIPEEEREAEIMGSKRRRSYTSRLQQSNSASIPSDLDETKKLPNELLIEIFGHIADLNGDPPSVLNLFFEPSLKLTRNEHQPLKTLSLVCWRWRNILLPDVFRYARVSLTPRPLWVCLCTSLEAEIKAKGLRGCSQHANDIIKTLRGRVELSPERGRNSKEPENPMDLEYIEDDEYDLLTLPYRFLHWIPSKRGEVDAFLQFVREKGLQSDIKSLVLQTDQELTLHLTGIEETIVVREVNFLWKTFLATLDLARLVIAAPPSTMAALTSSRDSHESWAFEMPLHYLCFSLQQLMEKEDNAPSSGRPSSSSSSSTTTSQRSSRQHVQICPHNLRPWTTMTYNEGTMLPGYAHYQWQTKLPPLILPTLLNFLRREIKHKRSPQLQAFTYISNFPYSFHIKDVVMELSQIPTLKVLKVKFAEPDYLDDGKARLGRGQTSDVWKEWEYSYKKVVRCFLKEARAGTVFESVDAGQMQMWKDVDRILREEGVWLKPNGSGRPFLKVEIGEGGQKVWVRREDLRGVGQECLRGLGW